MMVASFETDSGAADIALASIASSVVGGETGPVAGGVTVGTGAAVCSGAGGAGAAVQPAKTKALYFVARSDGSGGSVFSETLADHNRAVNQFQRGGKAAP